MQLSSGVDVMCPSASLSDFERLNKLTTSTMHMKAWPSTHWKPESACHPFSHANESLRNQQPMLITVRDLAPMVRRYSYYEKWAAAFIALTIEQGAISQTDIDAALGVSGPEASTKCAASLK